MSDALRTKLDEATYGKVNSRARRIHARRVRAVEAVASERIGRGAHAYNWNGERGGFVTRWFALASGAERRFNAKAMDTPNKIETRAGLTLHPAQAARGPQLRVACRAREPGQRPTLKTIGFDHSVRAQGPYLWDVAGTKYLDFLSGYGVLGWGAIILRCVVSSLISMPNIRLVKMEAPLLCGLLAEELKKHMPNQSTWSSHQLRRGGYRDRHHMPAAPPANRQSCIARRLFTVRPTARFP